MEKNNVFPYVGIKDSQWQGKLLNNNCMLNLFLIVTNSTWPKVHLFPKYNLNKQQQTENFSRLSWKAHDAPQE